MKKVITTFIATIFIGALLFGQCISGDCKSGKGIFIYEDGAKYIGDFHKSLRSGEGSCYYADGSRYEGYWEDDQPNGEGVKYYANGREESGFWKKGQLVETKVMNQVNQLLRNGEQGCVSGNCQNGSGIFVMPSGAVYEGAFSNGEIHGQGTCYYPDGSKYQGNWARRFPDGLGTKTFPDGSRRSGYWELGQPIDDNGNLMDALVMKIGFEGADLELQSGCLSGNCFDGFGKFAFPDGSRYEGNFRAGKITGSGTFFYTNGDKYVGSFKSGYRHGNGRIYRKNGNVMDGVWKYGEYIGSSEKPKAGCIAGNCKNGEGTYIFKNGSRYVGSFKYNLPHGKGTVYYANGEKYDGNWANATFNGFGILHLEDGTQVEGYWKKGTYVGAHQGELRSQERITQAKEPKTKPNLPDLKVWAIIIGVAAYQHMPVLRYTDDDAYRMFAFLKSPEGGALDDEQIRILIDEDATKSRIVNTMEDVFQKAGPNDLVMMYFSGHGLRGAFLPIDFDGYNNKLYHEEINEIIGKSKAKYKLFIADACHSGSLFAMRGGGVVQNTLINYYKSLAQSHPGTALIMSSKSDETSLESSGLRQGVFSHFLIRGMKGEADYNNDMYVNVDELYSFIQANVKNYTGNRQSPVIRGDYDRYMTVSVRRKE